ncbi:copper resistance protein CopC [Candidatus Acetothermia bacterium]|nr:copper resistance protein CopC [Candidatus Acetothermia bacterium]MBI3644275.1 copper resistance protein CopC [Candidatus Acetothermia bacterium]
MKKIFATVTRLSAFLVAVVAVGLFISGGITAAHPALIANQAVPTPGALLDTAPTQVKLTFTVENGLVAEQSFFWVYSQVGLTVLASGSVDLSNADRNTMIANLPALTHGVYVVKWVAISKSDTGFSEGSYSFAVK